VAEVEEPGQRGGAARARGGVAAVETRIADHAALQRYRNYRYLPNALEMLYELPRSDSQRVTPWRAIINRNKEWIGGEID
jgi:hypothetical protein